MGDINLNIPDTPFSTLGSNFNPQANLQINPQLVGNWQATDLKPLETPDIKSGKSFGQSLFNMGQNVKEGIGGAFNTLANNQGLQDAVFGVANSFIKPVNNSSGVDSAFQVGDQVANMLPGKAGLIAKGAVLGLKAINSIGGKKTIDFSVNQEAIAPVAGSYGGSTALFEDAASKAGQKYGLFSSSKRRKANALIREARRQQNIVQGIASENEDLQAMVDDMDYLDYQNEMNGGVDYRFLRAAKKGMKLKTLNRINNLNFDTNKTKKFKQGGAAPTVWTPEIIPVQTSWTPEIIEIHQEGGSINKNSDKLTGNTSLLSPLEEQRSIYYPKEYVEFIKDTKKEAPNLGALEPESYNMFRYWELNGKPSTFKEAIDKQMFTLENDGKYHAHSVAYNQELDEYEWMKNKKHSTAWMEKAWYDGYDFKRDKDGEPLLSSTYKYYEGTNPYLIPLDGKDLEEQQEFREKYELVEDENGWRKYVRRKTEFKKEGGSLKDTEEKPNEETSQKNVIPEGALHKNKHHIEHTEGLTQKGIPVIDNDGDQQAEIECDELILNLNNTKFIEERYRKFYSDDLTQKEKDQLAIEVGELLVQEILHNTDDFTGLINKVE